MTATGKSTVGKLVAKTLGYDFVDSDTVIEERAGAAISWIFEIEGEQKFRERETALLRELTAMDNIVLATGGGAVLRQQNRRMLQTHGWVACLTSPLEVLAKRVEQSTTRPLLQDVAPLKRLKEMQSKRMPLYDGIADRTFDTMGMTTQETAREITDWFCSKAP